jgi:hypothetical protein
MSSERLPKIAAATFIVGCLLVFLIEAGIARIIGVPMIFVGIFLGVAAIASPDFLEADRER